MSGPLGSQQWMYDSGEAVTQQSLKFNDDESQYLSWTPAAAGNSRTWTWSAWVKRGNLDSFQYLFSSDSSSSGRYSYIRFNTTNELVFYSGNFDSGTQIINLKTTQVFRDCSSFYHIVVVADIQNATSTDRARMYVNGERVSAFTTESYPPNIANETYFNQIKAHNIGRFGTNQYYYDGYMSNIHFIDGQALDPTSFGETVDGYWKAKDYAGTYGTNGFRLTFEDDVVSEGFNTVTYRGNGGTQSISGLGFEPDFVWIKERSSTSGHALHDSVRGAGKYLGSHSQATEGTSTTQVTSFDADGFTTGASGQTNENNQTYVSWCWDAGSGSATLNEDGSIDSTVKANPDYGFSIVKWVGDGTSQGATVGHSLGVTPDMFIVKSTDSTASWNVWHKDLTNATTSRVLLDDDSDEFDSVYVWGSTAPDNSAFGVGTFGSSTWTNRLNRNYIAYCFSSVAGYSYISSYSGTGANGHKITTGFSPAFIMLKRYDSGSVEDWLIYDNTRNPVNLSGNEYVLRPNTSGDEQAYGSIDFESDGFTLQTVGGALNASGGSYLVMAFADTREAAFWKDVSGQGNNWTPNNLDYRDSLPDSPTNNFAVLNPLAKSQYASLSEGNLKIAWSNHASANYAANPSTITLPRSGKWYFELSNAFADGNNSISIGICDATQIANGGNATPTNYYLYRSDNNNTFNGYYSDTGNAGSLTTFLGSSPVCGIAVDLDAGKFWAAVNNTWQGSGSPNPATGADAGFSSISTSVTWVPFVGGWEWTGSATTATINFGQDSTFAGAKPMGAYTDDNGIGNFQYAPPAGYLALCTANLPTPTIIDGSEHFNTLLYTGTGTTDQAVTGVGFQPDFTWIKSYSNAYANWLNDSVRGAGKGLRSEETDAEYTTLPIFLSFDTDGFTVDVDTGTANNTTNGSGSTFAAWNWKAGGTAVSNTDGSITSSVSANTTAGFSIVQFVGDANGSSTVGHGLSKTPNMVIVKPTSQVDAWAVYHSSLGVDKTIELQSGTGEQSGSGYWGSVTPSVFGLSAGGTNNRSGATHIAYCFADTEGYLKAGSYIGGGSNFPFVYTGFRPAWVMIKRADSTSDWWIFDTARDTYNRIDSVLYANLSIAEFTDTGTIFDFDLLSNGFRNRSTNSTVNGSGATYIYLAFAETPFKYANAR